MNNNGNNGNGIKRVAMFSMHSDPLAAIGSMEAGGQNVYIKNLVTHLDKIGWSVDVFCRLDSAHKKQVAKIGKRSRIIRLRAGRPIYVHKSQLRPYFPEFYQNFLSFINFQNPYLLFHGHHYDGGAIALLVHKELKKPLIINFHSLGQVRYETQKKYAFNGNEQKLFDERITIEKNIIQNVSLIISLAETEKRDLRFFYGAPEEKIAVIPGGVNIKEFAPIPKEKARKILNLPKEDFILLFVGRLEWRKGIGTLIGATRLLQNDIPNVRDLIIGGRIFGLQKNRDDFKEYQRLLKKARDAGIQDKIQFMGRVDQGRLHACYSSGDILVVPSYYEPFGLVALEGMAAKIPVVASRKGGLRFTVQDGKNGLLFEPHNAADLKEKILQIYRSPEMKKSLAENAYEDAVEKYSWKNIAKKISDEYIRIINKNEKINGSPNSAN